MTEIDRKVVTIDQLWSILEALNELQLEYDVQKRYRDEQRPGALLGVAQYTVILYSRNGDVRRRVEALKW